MDINASNAFVREFEAYLACFEDTVRIIPKEAWTQGDSPRTTPVHQACHCLAPVVGYTGADIQIDDLMFLWKKPQQYPDTARVLDVAAAVRKVLPDYIREVLRRNSSEREFSYPPLFKLIYLLRHSVIHLSYLRDELIRRDMRLPGYSKRYRPRG